jgi:hypothetical protein
MDHEWNLIYPSLMEEELKRSSLSRDNPAQLQRVKYAPNVGCIVNRENSYCPPGPMCDILQDNPQNSGYVYSQPIHSPRSIDFDWNTIDVPFASSQILPSPSPNLFGPREQTRNNSISTERESVLPAREYRIDGELSHQPPPIHENPHGQLNSTLIHNDGIDTRSQQQSEFSGEMGSSPIPSCSGARMSGPSLHGLSNGLAPNLVVDLVIGEIGPIDTTLNIGSRLKDCGELMNNLDAQGYRPPEKESMKILSCFLSEREKEAIVKSKWKQQY